MKKTNIKMYMSKETLQQAPQNKRKESDGSGPTERNDKTTIAGVPKGIPQTYRLWDYTKEYRNHHALRP